jgi:hypothetical protein
VPSGPRFKGKQGSWQPPPGPGHSPRAPGSQRPKRRQDR